MPLNIDIQQILLHLFNFVILGGGLYLLLYKPVKDFMDKRTTYYEKMDADADKKMAQATDLESAYNNKLAEADSEIAQKKEAAAQEAEKASRETLQNAQAQAQKILTDAKANAEAERAKIVSSAQQEIADLAAAAAGNIVQQSMDSTYGAFLDAAQEGEANGGQEN